MAVLPPSPDGAWLQEPGAGDELALLDWLLPGGGEVGGAAALEEWPQDAGAHYARGPTPPAASPPPRVRCLNSKHAPGCAACLPPPPEGQDALYQLRPPPGAEAGEKGPNGSCMLRAQLLATEQWNSRAAREALAAAEEARGDPTGVAQMLRRKAGKLLLKPHMLCLARAWGYASDLWTRRGVAGSSRKRTRGADQPSPSSPEQLSGHATSRVVAVPRLLSVVEPLVLAPGGAPCALRALWQPAAENLQGQHARALSLRTGFAFVVWADAEHAVFDSVLSRVIRQLGCLEASQAAWSEALRAHVQATDGDAEHSARIALPDGRLPLCMVSPLPDGGDEAPVQEALRCVLSLCDALRGTIAARRAAAGHALPAKAGHVDFAASDAERDSIFMHCSRFVAEGMLVLQYLKARGSCDGYLDAAAEIVREVKRFAEEARANTAVQRSWMASQCAAGTLVPLLMDETGCAIERAISGLPASSGLRDSMLSGGAHVIEQLPPCVPLCTMQARRRDSPGAVRALSWTTLTSNGSCCSHEFRHGSPACCCLGDVSAERVRPKTAAPRRRRRGALTAGCRLRSSTAATAAAAAAVAQNVAATAAATARLQSHFAAAGSGSMRPMAAIGALSVISAAASRAAAACGSLIAALATMPSTSPMLATPRAAHSSAALAAIHRAPRDIGGAVSGCVTWEEMLTTIPRRC